MWPVRANGGLRPLFWLEHLALTGLVPLPESELPVARVSPIGRLFSTQSERFSA